jgi:phospholipase/carboxylesterase
MPAWYDILAMSLEREIDEQQLLASCAAISAFIDREIERGIDSQRIIIAGFSQGGAVAYHAALTYPQPLGGLMALSSYFATYQTLVPNPANASLAIAIFHGIYDGVVSETLASQALQVLRNKGYSPVYKSYLMEHEVCMEEVADISMWLQQCLA